MAATKLNFFDSSTSDRGNLPRIIVIDLLTLIFTIDVVSSLQTEASIYMIPLAVLVDSSVSSYSVLDNSSTVYLTSW